jgi:hypothetical protein
MIVLEMWWVGMKRVYLHWDRIKKWDNVNIAMIGP